MTAFATEQWHWAASDEARSFGPMRNAVTVYPDGILGEARVVHVDVPTEFFQYLIHALPYGQIRRVQNGEAAFCLVREDVGPKRVLFTFGFTIGDDVYHPLWPYTLSEVPVWASKALR